MSITRYVLFPLLCLGLMVTGCPQAGGGGGGRGGCERRVVRGRVGRGARRTTAMLRLWAWVLGVIFPSSDALPGLDRPEVTTPALAQIRNQGRHRSIQLPGLVGDAAKQSAMMIPALIEQLDETDAPLGHPPSLQAVRGERSRPTGVDAVHIEGLFRFAAQVG